MFSIRDTLVRFACLGGYFYLLRIPLLSWLLLAGVSQLGSPGGAMLPGVFDVSSFSPQPWQVILQFGFLTLIALLAVCAIGVTARLVVVFGQQRFGAAAVPLTPGIELLVRLVPLSGAFFIWLAAFRTSTALWPWKLAGTLSGIVFFAICLGIFYFLWYWLVADAVAENVAAISRTARFAALIFLVLAAILGWFGQTGWAVLAVMFALLLGPAGIFGRPLVDRIGTGDWIPGDPAGYLDNQGRLHGRHLFAMILSSVSLWVYAFMFAIKYIAGSDSEPLVPTVGLVLMLLMPVCWVLGAIAFFLDRYRVPLLMTVVLYAYAVSFFKQGDHYYRAYPRPDRVDQTHLLPGDVLLKKPDQPVVLVATTGGGIQAAAWTARVLAGLAEDARAENFDEHIRLISSVSGGSLGTLLFAGAYEKGRLKQLGAPDNSPVVKAAEQSSLDELTRGLAYPDFLFGLFPFAKGIDFRHGEFHWASGWLITTDRGSALEDTWRARMVTDGDARLSVWRRRADRGDMPSVIFNSTIVESGNRFLLGTADFERTCPGEPVAAPPRVHTGRTEFRNAYCDSDIPASTGARLSATFPFVTAASRIFRPFNGGIHKSEVHAVDGGYYDNYGMATLLDWLDTALNEVHNQSPPILIIEIRSSSTDESAPSGEDPGWFFQTLHPLSTLWNVRGTSQLSRNLEELALLRASHPTVSIQNVEFEFNFRDSRGGKRVDPLNWHLRPDDIQALRAEWNDEKRNDARKKVRTFLAGGAKR